MRGRSPLRARLAASLGAVLLLASAGVASADTVDECVSANTAAQALRRDGKLSSARAKLLQCGSSSCPAMVRDDCTRRLDDVDKAMPTIVFDLKDGAGHDLIDVTATVDGQPLIHALDGAPLPFDPGDHVFVFTEAGQPPVTQSFVLKEGEKDRRERIVIGAAPAPVASTGPAIPSAPPATSGMPTQKVAALVVGGAGAVGLVVGAIFGGLTLSSASTQKSDCSSPTNCAHYSQAASAHSSGETDATVSNVGFIAGGALLAAGAVLFFTAPRSSEQSPAAARLEVIPGVGPGSAGIWAQGAF